ncbi:MAG: hypothetical protein L3J32_08570 [Rhizobiaceae bacterium]|nr:hypothetical protein [Rhizobiaceae bacterium]
MPLELFAILVPLGIALIVLVVHYSGLSKKALLRDGAHAIDLLLEDYGAEKSTGSSILTIDNRAAFIELESGDRLGLVETMGDRFVTRILNHNDLGEYAFNNDNILSVKYHDFTHPAGTYKFGNDNIVSRVADWLKNLKEEK